MSKFREGEIAVTIYSEHFPQFSGLEVTIEKIIPVQGYEIHKLDLINPSTGRNFGALESQLRKRDDPEVRKQVQELMRKFTKDRIPT